MSSRLSRLGQHPATFAEAHKMTKNAAVYECIGKLKMQAAIKCGRI